MYRINAAIWYNKKCKINGITPNYINIKVNGNNKQSQRTKETAIRYRINQEIKFLHNKKRYINHQLYEAHLTGANEWNNIWTTLEQNSDTCLNKEMEKNYTNLNKKLDRLTRQQKKETKQTYHNDETQFHERTVNLTTIKFDKEEKILIDKGVQYSIEKPIGIYWNDIIIDTEQAIKKLEPRLQEAYRIIAAQKLNKMKE